MPVQNPLDRAVYGVLRLPHKLGRAIFAPSDPSDAANQQSLPQGWHAPLDLGMPPRFTGLAQRESGFIAVIAAAIRRGPD
jgi:hypothetical protein